MVAGNDYFISEFELLEIFEEVLEVLVAAVVGEITCVNEDVAGQLSHPLQLLQVAVGVR